MAPMQLSEAIRLGAMSTKPAGIYNAFEYGDGGGVCATCAIGAAAFAVGITHVDGFNLLWDWDGEYAARFPILNAKAAMPYGVYVGDNVGQIASAMFQRGHTREQIADWVETIERRADADRAAQTETPSTAVSLVAQK